MGDSHFPEPRRQHGHRLSPRALIALGVSAFVVVGAGSVGGTLALTSTLETVQTQAAGAAQAQAERSAREQALAEQRAREQRDAGSDASSGATASAAQSAGIVTITTQLPYQNEEGAGTGMVLTSSGLILTNNHVIESSTSITVTVVSTDQSYPATVVGTDLTDDIAVLQVQGASGLPTAAIDTGSDVAPGDSVTAVGNAGGTGTLTAAAGTVTALDQTITTQPEATAVSETLNGLIETDADIQAGDSGGPLYDADGRIVGIDTAAASGSARPEGYAIPIDAALSIAQQIASGTASSTVTIGYPAFLGVEVASDPAAGNPAAGDPAAGDPAATPGAPISDVIADGPAATAGITAGDTVTAIDATPITSPTDLTAALRAYKPGQSATVTWTDTAGQSHTAAVTLGQGPAD